jgi:ABC-type transporter Mla subunit MlaD
MAEERFRGVEIKVGAVVVAVGVLFVLSLLYIGYRKDLFAPKQRYFLRAETGQDLSVGMPIKFSGFQIGSVKELHLEQDGSMRLKIKILKRYSKWVRTDSVFTLAREGMIGPPVIVLKTGKGEPAREDTEFVLQRERGLEGIAEDLKKEVVPVLREVAASISEIHKLLASINDPEGNYQRTLANVERATRALNEGEGLVRYVLHDRDSTGRVKAILQRVENLTDSLNSAASNISSGSSNINKAVSEIRSLVVQLQKSILEIKEQLIPALKNIRNSSEQLPELTNKVNYSLELGKDLMLKLHNTWPLSRQQKVQKRPKLPSP